jgi:hypothetical protein
MFTAIGSGGAVLLIILALIIHKRGSGKLQLVKQDHVIYWGFGLGQLATTTSYSLARSIDHSVQSIHAAGVVGPATAALALILVAFGTEARFIKDLICGIAAPGVFAMSGIDLLVSTGSFVSGALHGVVG